MIEPWFRFSNLNCGAIIPIMRMKKMEFFVCVSAPSSNIVL